MRDITWYRLRRFVASGSPILFLGGTALVGAATQISGKAAIAVWPALTVGIGLVLAQMYSDYRKRTYDPTWIQKLDELFDSPEMRRTRAHSAKVLLSKLKSKKDFQSDDVDALLGFFERLAFYVVGDQASPEMAHHIFHYWIRGYLSATDAYVERARRYTPTLWEHTSHLLKVTHEIDMERTKGPAPKKLSGEDLSDFLKEEIRLGKIRPVQKKQSRPS
jgi:hypothetical protein